ncbi:MAG: acetylglutamate kinase [Candidatus Limnocylindrales bacterium]
MNGPIVVKLGGTTIEEQAGVLGELSGLAERERLIVVHGGGGRVTSWLERLGIDSHFEAGRRVTDAAALEVAIAVLGGVVNTELVAALRGLGADAVGLSGVDGGLLQGRRLPGWGFVAEITDVRHALLDDVLAQGRLPVVAPLALDDMGAVCNVNADDAAVAIARELHAERLVLLTDSDGVRDAKGERIGIIDAGAADALIAAGVIAGGMIPKVRAALGAVAEGGAAEAVIADGAEPHAIVRALEDPTFGSRAMLTTSSGGLR